MTDPTTVSIEGPATAHTRQALSYVADYNPAIGDCEGGSQPGQVFAYLAELERLASSLGWDFAVAAAHASAQTNAFTSDAWTTSLNTLPADATQGETDQPLTFDNPRAAAAAHMTYLSTFVGGDSVDTLRDAGFTELVPGSDTLAIQRSRNAPARTAADLASGPLDPAKLGDHLAGIRDAADFTNEVETVSDAAAGPTPPLPEIELRPTEAHFTGRSGVGPVAICYHMTWDLNLQNVIRTFQNPDNNKSANFVIARDGTAFQLVHSKNAPWTNGDYKTKDRNTGRWIWNNPREDIPWLKRAVEKAEQGGANLNRYTITYEFIGTPDDPAHEPQYRTAINLSRYFCHVYDISPHRGHQIRHGDINQRNRSYDPGRRFDLARIIEELGGDPTKMTG
ncbi:MAG: N-acetylmuramoyl-L-alanine amidase [Chloroflexia bacterium]|nr:N-acetylmuramoyl-L-alanine amidase [Chloroflexia bacterium]